MDRLIGLLLTLYIRRKWKLNKNAAGMLCGCFLNDHRMHKAGFRNMCKIHSYGFCVDDWKSARITEATKDSFLSTAEYYGLHPFNGKFTRWIDDKLTLKYLCAGTILDHYLPKYYYLIDNKGQLSRLCDSPANESEPTTDEMATLLRQEGVLAIKLRAGAIGRGFYKAAYSNGSYYMNDEQMDFRQFQAAIGRLRDCLVTEYLRPHADMAKYCPNVTNTIRYLSAKWNGDCVMLKSFARFGTLKSGFVENYNKGGILCYIEEDGSFQHGHVLNFATGEDTIIYEHPDNRQKISGNIPHWADIQRCAKAFHNYFPMLEFLGFDFVVTQQGKVKILEINSLTSLDSLQLEGSILESKYGGYFKQKLSRTN